MWSHSTLQKCSSHTSLTQSKMVRNVDLPEAVIMYGIESVIINDGSQEIRPGLKPLLEECRDEGTAVVLIDDSAKENEDVDVNLVLPSDIQDLIGFTYHEKTHYPPNPRSLYEVMESVTIQPRGFGGSSGFGRAVAESERNPLPKHVVVFGCDLQFIVRGCIWQYWSYRAAPLATSCGTILSSLRSTAYGCERRT